MSGPGEHANLPNRPSRQQSAQHRKSIIQRWSARPDIQVRFAHIDELRWHQLRTAGINVERLIVPAGLKPPRKHPGAR